MDLGRGFPTPREKGIIQNGNIWIPSTPDKPVLQKSSNTQSEMSQNQIGEENWQDLLGIYTGVLQKDMANGLPQKLYCNSSTSPSPEDHNIQRIVQQNSSPTMVYEPHSKTQISQNVNNHIFNRAGRNVKHNIQYFSSLQKLASFNQNARSIGSYNGQNFGEAAYPQKVNSLAELMDISRLVHAPPSNGASNRSSGVIVRPTNICPHSQIESNQVAHASIGTKLRQSHFLNLNHDVDGCNLQEMTNGGLSVRNYNLNLPPAPEAGESSSVVVRPFPLGPVTPDRQKQSKSYQSTQVPQLSIDETSTQEKCIQNNAPQPESLLHTPSTSAAVISTSFREINNCGGGNEGIDLNQTPQQKPPKRKKHRPKVVNEGKRKRGPKPAGTKSDILDGNPKVKRKYVRKNGVKSSETPLLDNAINAVEASNGRPSKRSRKRKLNFDLENGAENERKERKEKGLNCQTQNNEGGKLPFNLNLDAHNAEVNGPPRFLENKNTCGRKIHHTENANNFVHSINKVTPQESLLLVNMSPSPPTPKDRTLNVIARILNMRNASANQITDVNRYNQVNHCITGGLGQHVIHANASLPNLYNKKQPAVPTIPQLVQDLVNVPEIQGAERLYTHIETRHPHTITLMGSQLLSNAVSEMGHSNRDSGSLLKKGINTGNKFYKTSSCLPSEVTTDEGFFRQNGSRNKNFDVQSYAMMQQSGVSANSDIRGQSMSTNPNDRSNNVPRDWYMNNPFCTHKLHQQHVSSQVHICSERVAPILTSHAPVIEQGTSTLTVVTYQNLGSASQSGPKSIPLTDIRNTADPVSVTRRIAGQASSNKVPNVGKSLEHEAKKRRNYRNSSKEVTGSQEERMISIDYITNLLKDLHIYSDGQRAVVPYKGDGAVILYEEFDLVKRRRPRPRVDLDPETNRLWNLLMGKEGGESAETMDTDKQKWWEEERKVFQGRVDSFIARMHLVQGDRRFSKWKGSVVDSVIGVFLTQNVSDHLSSSAFMCLAAKFPLKSTTVCQPRGKNGGSSSVEHHEVRITYPDGTTYDHRIPEEPASNHSSVTSIESSEYRAENLIVEKRTLVVNNHTRNTEEDIISSQSSSESFVFQANEDVRSSSGSNSEAEDGWNLSKNLGSERFTASQQYQYQCKESSHPYKELLFGHQQLENSAPRQNQGLAASSNAYSFAFSSEVPYKQPSVLPFTNYWPNLSLGLEKWEADILAFSGKESISTLASTQFEITNGTYVKYAHDYIAQSSDSTSTSIQNGIPKFQPSAVNDSILNKHLELKTDFRDKSENRNGHHFVKHARGMQESPQQGNTSLTDPSRSAEAFSKLSSDMYRNASTSFNVQDSFDAQVNFVTDRRKHAGDTTHEPTERGQVISSNKHASHIGTATPNARKRKVEQEKTQPFDWDTLRKQVQSKDGTRERCRQRMDSLDYEALRNADVREISDTIKERGMNNMLAERMKSFLDRLVQDHERIDLEWLRDVEPDKAKDYLLSIRGLGLKSVECIRLLTLHHLAFPVDTNVGRIAVRLGWVPLQPLPESLQLHLLELYPVLESIQKYLWPRLCKLDQETLYELHYQMITFGKVFCTKREPNCNACPMRGECRHFASAFASARLALPGPEENRIVSSAAPVNANKGPDVIIKPTPLISSSDRNVDKSTRNCQPVIEEPTTPEPPEELSERDIEDAFYEDPDEIPVIKLDVQEFTTNLQSFMQKQMELGEADMSKALVALSPGLASIPVPKLKNISRLRTEHQVYELPDSHPLLKWMGRREPDDPSPYLLAIWTPGETADSVQPPESKCSSQEGSGLCNKETCFSCNSTREAQTQTVRGTILVPCRTAMRGSFPLNGTYFQVNEVFADHESSLNPIDVPRSFLWNLPRRTVFFGTSVSTIFKGLSTEGIQYCFWRGFVCVRGFDQKTRAPRPLRARLHFPASKIPKRNE